MLCGTAAQSGILAGVGEGEAKAQVQSACTHMRHAVQARRQPRANSRVPLPPPPQAASALARALTATAAWQDRVPSLSLADHLAPLLGLPEALLACRPPSISMLPSDPSELSGVKLPAPLSSEVQKKMLAVSDLKKVVDVLKEKYIRRITELQQIRELSP